jgi:hypothetical protein
LTPPTLAAPDRQNVNSGLPYIISALINVMVRLHNRPLAMRQAPMYRQGIVVYLAIDANLLHFGATTAKTGLTLYVSIDIIVA